MIDISNLEEDDNIQLCIVKKYRAENNGEKKTNYSFFKIGLKKDISQEIKKWVINNFESVKNEKVIDYNPSTELEELEKINLGELEAWGEFERNAFPKLNFRDIKLKQISKGAVGAIIFIKKGNITFGQIRRIYPKYILSKGLSYLLYFDGSKFDELREEKGIRLDKKADFIFYSDDKKAEGIILNKDNFNFIFDVWEEYRKKALKNSKNIKIFNGSSCFNFLYDVVKEDRQIQRMLINPIIEKYLNEISYQELFSLKQNAPDLNFELDEEKQDFVLPAGREKEAIRDLIKAVSGRFGFTINKKHLVENSGVRRVLT